MSFSFTPEQKQTWLWLAFGLLLIALLVFLGPVLMPFVTAAILAYALNPGVDWLSSHRIGKLKMPRSVAVLIVMLLLSTALLALVLIVFPVMQKEIILLQDQIPGLLTKLNTTLTPLLHDLGLNKEVRLDGTGIRKLLSQYFNTGSDGIWSTLLSSARIGGIAVLGWIVNLVLIPVVLFYLLLDWHTFLARVVNLIPRRWVGQTVGLGHEVNLLLAQYLRGQLLVMLILAAYYSVSLMVAGFDVALPVGIVTGLLVFIPYLGFGLGLALAVVAAVLQFSGWQGLIAVATIYGIGQIVEGFFLTPRLVGERIGLHPLTIIFALLAFGQLFGFVGVLLALPASAIVSVGMKHLRMHYLASSFYKQP